MLEGGDLNERAGPDQLRAAYRQLLLVTATWMPAHLTISVNTPHLGGANQPQLIANGHNCGDRNRQVLIEDQPNHDLAIWRPASIPGGDGLPTAVPAMSDPRRANCKERKSRVERR